MQYFSFAMKSFLSNKMRIRKVAKFHKLGIKSGQNIVTFCNINLSKMAKQKICLDNITFHLETYRLIHVAMVCATYSWRLVNS